MWIVSETHKHGSDTQTTCGSVEIDEIFPHTRSGIIPFGTSLQIVKTYVVGLTKGFYCGDYEG